VVFAEAPSPKKNVNSFFNVPLERAVVTGSLLIWSLPRRLSRSGEPTLTRTGTIRRFSAPISTREANFPFNPHGQK